MSFLSCSCTIVNPWDDGRFQALAFAKVWSEKARLPSSANMWKKYHGPVEGAIPGFGGSKSRIMSPQSSTSHFLLSSPETQHRFVSWLNKEALKFGGNMISPLKQYVTTSLESVYDPLKLFFPSRDWNALNYFFRARYGFETPAQENSQFLMSSPKTKWDSGPRSDGRHWAELSMHW